MTPEEYYNNTPFWFHIKQQAYMEKVKTDNIVNLYLLNTVSNLFAEKGNANYINYDDIFGILQLKDYNLKSRNDFESLEEFKKYLKEVVQPIKKELGVI